jgi:uncharacterized membrane protein
MGKISFLAGVGLGAGLVYYLDPELGEQRRLRMRHRLARLSNPDAVPDVAVAGALPARRQDDLPAFRFDEEREEGIPVGGIVMGLAGGALVAYGLIKRGRFGKVIRRVGVGMLTKGVSEMDVPGMTGFRERRRAVDLQKSFQIDAPVDRVFRFWRDYQHFPLFLSEVEEVTDLGGGRSHWVVRGPHGEPLDWDAHIVALEPNQLIAWRSEPDAPIPNRGEVHFTPVGNGTRVDLRICYAPRTDRAGDAVAALLGPDPRARMNQDLERVRAMVEQPGGTAGSIASTREAKDDGEE